MTALSSRPGASLPSDADLLGQEAETGYYSTCVPLDNDREALLLRRFWVSYVYLLPERALEELCAKPGKVPASVAVSPIDRRRVAPAVDFIVANYYERYRQHYDEVAIRRSRGLGKRYLKDVGQGVLYSKKGRVVGCLLGHSYPTHPGLKVETFHIGYWGLDRGLLSSAEAGWLKQDWLGRLRKWSGGVPIDASVDCFNTSGTKFVSRLGFRQRMLRLDRKVSVGSRHEISGAGRG